MDYSRRNSSSNQYRHHGAIKQELIQEDINVVRFGKNPETFFAAKTEPQRKLINILLWLDSNKKEVFVSQDYLALKSGLCREQVNRLTSQFEEEGILTKIWRGVKETCIYRVSNYFHNPRNRHRLTKFFAALAFMPFNWFFLRNGEWVKMPNSQVRRTNVTQYKDISSSTNYISSIPAIFSSRPDSLHERAREARGITGSGITIKREIVGENRIMDHQPPIRASIRELKHLDLTIHGQMRLTVFPDRALEYGQKKIQYSIAAKDKFALFWSLCRDYCKENGLELDWKAFDRLKNEYGYPVDAAVVNPPSVPKVAKAEEKLPQRGTGLSEAQRVSQSASRERCKQVADRKEKDRVRAQAQQGIFEEKKERACLSTMDAQQRKEYISQIHPAFRTTALRLFICSTLIGPRKKLDIIETMGELSIPLGDMLTQLQLDEIVAAAIMSEEAGQVNHMSNDDASS